MIKIDTPQDCCGCNACVQRCPKQCITMHCDQEGFWYPVVNEQECINCGLCEKTCPVLHPKTESKPQKTYAAINNNEDIRLASSSGGIFTILAEETLKQGGVVFGAAFNKNWEVEHIAVYNTTELEKLRGSKYVQSDIGNCYKEAEQLLKKGRKVLFSGTPCQIAALKLFLNKDYENLTTIDVVCHGTPSPKVWEMYLKETNSKILKDIPDKKIQYVSPMDETYKSCIEAISFRSKITGWKKYSFLLKLNFPNYDGKNTAVFAEDLHKNSFMQCFLANLCLRPSCYTCPARGGKSDSDITLADLWGAEQITPHMDDDKGISLLLIKNKKIEIPCCELHEIEYNDALAHNPSIEKDVAIPTRRNKFFKQLHKKGMYAATLECLHRSRFEILWEKFVWNINNRVINNIWKAKK